MQLGSSIGFMVRFIFGSTGFMWWFNGWVWFSDDGQSAERTCTITGPPDRMQMAASMIQDLINNAMVRNTFIVLHYYT